MLPLPAPTRLAALAALAALLALPACFSNQTGPISSTPAPARATTSPAITAADLRTRLFIIADDSMQGRQFGKVGNVKATAYIASEVKRLGLEPAGDNGTYFQTVPAWLRVVDPNSTLSVNGTALTLWTDYAPLQPGGAAASGGSFASDGALVIYGGRVGDSTAMITTAQAAGKLVVLAPALNPDGTPSPVYQGRVPTDRFAGALAIAIATLDIMPPGPATQLRVARTVVAASPAVAPGPLGMVITAAAAARLLGGPLQNAKPGGTGGTAQGRVAFTMTPTEAPARNVVAILRGSDPARNQEYVAVGAHSDHVGMAPKPVDHDSSRAFNRVMRPEGAQTRAGNPTAEQWAVIRASIDSIRKLRPPRADSVFNGADDDGSGTVNVLEIAEAFATTPERPKRSIIFVWHTGEEAGLLGSQWFTDHPTVPRDSIVAQLNMDMVGRGRAEDIPGGNPLGLQVIGSRRLSTQLGDIVDSVNAARPQPMKIDYSFDATGHPLNRYCRSDHYMYARYGIPITYFSLGYHIDYHQLGDEPQYIDYDHSARVGNLVHDIALAVANRDQRLVVDKPKPDPKGGCRQ